MANQFIIFLRRLWLQFIRHGLKVLGVCGACFLIEACYGTPQADYANAPLKDVDVSGTIKGPDGATLSNIPVLLTNGRFGDTLKAFTNNKGIYSFSDVRYSRQLYHLIINSPAGVSETLDFAVDKEALAAKQKHLDVQLKSR